MDGKDKITASTGTPSFSLGGQEQTEAMRKMQKEFLDACEQASRAWLARMQSEAEFWTGLSSKLGATKSLPEAFETYQKSMTQRMQMASDDGRRMVEDYQKIMSKMTQPLGNGRLAAGS